VPGHRPEVAPIRRHSYRFMLHVIFDALDIACLAPKVGPWDQ